MIQKNNLLYVAVGLFSTGFVKNVVTRKKTALDRGWTDCISLTHNLDLDLWHCPSIVCELWSWPTHMQKFQVSGQSVLKIEWKQTDGETVVGDRISEGARLKRSVITKRCRKKSPCVYDWHNHKQRYRPIKCDSSVTREQQLWSRNCTLLMLLLYVLSHTDATGITRRQWGKRTKTASYYYFFIIIIYFAHQNTSGHSNATTSSHCLLPNVPFPWGMQAPI